MNKVGDPILKYYESYPRAGKHLAFNGAFLHGAPAHDKDDDSTVNEESPTFKDDGVVDSSHPVSLEINHHEEAIKEGQESRKISDSKNRVTFLVNIWLNHRPVDVHPLPEAIRQALAAEASSASSSSFFSSEVPINPPTASKVVDAVQDIAIAISENATSEVGEFRSGTSGDSDAASPVCDSAPPPPAATSYIPTASGSTGASLTGSAPESSCKPSAAAAGGSSYSVWSKVSFSPVDTATVRVTGKDVEADEDGSWVILPFVSDKVEFYRDGLVCIVVFCDIWWHGGIIMISVEKIFMNSF